MLSVLIVRCLVVNGVILHCAWFAKCILNCAEIAIAFILEYLNIHFLHKTPILSKNLRCKY